jgi:hypothetical protein
VRATIRAAFDCILAQVRYSSICASYALLTDFFAEHQGQGVDCVQSEILHGIDVPCMRSTVYAFHSGIFTPFQLTFCSAEYAFRL